MTLEQKNQSNEVASLTLTIKNVSINSKELNFCMAFLGREQLKKLWFDVSKMLLKVAVFLRYLNNATKIFNYS